MYAFWESLAASDVGIGMVAYSEMRFWDLNLLSVAHLASHAVPAQTSSLKTEGMGFWLRFL